MVHSLSPQDHDSALRNAIDCDDTLRNPLLKGLLSPMVSVCGLATNARSG
jgi:hypothetical protein